MFTKKITILISKNRNESKIYYKYKNKEAFNFESNNIKLMINYLIVNILLVSLTKPRKIIELY